MPHLHEGLTVENPTDNDAYISHYWMLYYQHWNLKKKIASYAAIKGRAVAWMYKRSSIQVVTLPKAAQLEGSPRSHPPRVRRRRSII